eukprot:1829297-Amphidinium_carterae.1
MDKIQALVQKYDPLQQEVVAKEPEVPQKKVDPVDPEATQPGNPVITSTATAKANGATPKAASAPPLPAASSKEDAAGCFCQLSGDPISSAMTTRANAEPSLLPAPVQRTQRLDACVANCKASIIWEHLRLGQQLAFVSLHDCAQWFMCTRPIVDILPIAFDIAQTYCARSLHGSSQACIALGGHASFLTSSRKCGADVVTHALHAAHDHTPLEDYFNRLSLQEITPEPLMPGVPHGEPHTESMVSPRTIDVSGAIFLGQEHGE